MYMKKTFLLSLFLLLTVIMPMQSIAANWLFHNGKSNYRIVISAEASTSEQTAARELQKYINQVSGVELPVTTDINTRGHCIYVGHNERVATLTGAQKPNKDDESFTIRTIGHNLFIWGGSQRGTMYGVFTFLERELGIHWLTPKCTVIPKNKQWKLPHLNHTESPFIGYRYSNYFVAEGAPEWSAHTRENTKWSPVTNEYGNIEAYWGAHTMEKLVPTKEFYETHPEYFCLRDGQRYNGYGQLCLSNPEVLELCKTRLKQYMRENPNFRIYSLSQNEAFMRDLRGWAELAPHLFIWDYIVDYAQYMAPWPNFQVLGPNIRVFGENKAIGVFEEAQYQSAGAEFDEMKAWTVNQLLWNPDQDVDSLVNIFIDGFYGKAAPHIMDYYRLCQSLVKPDVHFGIYITENHEIYSDDFTQKAFAILQEARKAAESDEIRERVDRVRMQPLYLQCMRHKAESLKDGTWEELRRLMKQYKAMHREGHPQERFIREFEQ